MSDERHDGPELVDWDFAVQTASRFVRPGPDISRAQARDVVAELRAGARSSESHVRGYTGLHAATATAPVVVIDRPGWVQANADGFRAIMRPLIAKLTEKRGTPGGLARVIGSRVTGFEAGALLGYLAGRVLGQFDPFWPNGGLAAGAPQRMPTPQSGPVSAAPTGRPIPTGGGSAELARRPPAGRMLLVAPNIVHTERELEVDPHHFRLWVCVHEETHRVQFTAVPWMRDHLHSEIRALIDATEVDPSALAAMLRDGVERAARMARGDDDISLLDIIQTPAQREIVGRITATMSLLEGHADVVMDGVGPEVIPTVDVIRTRFNERRKGGGTLDQVLRKLLGLDAKMRQYRDGATFVRGALERVGMDGLNAVWTSPNTLPSLPEIGDPAAWVRRVHG
ncbi:MAG: zinc-dependent metalloprotease [Actinomycetota bacterium]|nr:zinc-dependent metalloprotease [Actinomycetota bacterium]